MQGRLENQIKTEKKIQRILSDMPREVSEYYINFSSNKEFRSCLSYVQKIKRFLTWYCSRANINMQEIDFSQISDTDIASYLKDSETKVGANGEIEYTSFSYRKQIWSVLNSFFNFLDKKRKIDSNPVRLIERPAKNDKVNHVYLNREDLDKMIETIKKDISDCDENDNEKKWKTRDLAILYMFIFTGMRESALCEIDLNKIDFENNIIEVIDKEHKTNTYSISSKLEEIISAWISYRKEILKDSDNDALFISNQKKRINQETVRVIVRKYSEIALGQKVSPHRLRAAYGNIIYRETHDIKFTSKAMKHENISTTQIYMEDDEQATNKQVADIMSNIF